MCARTILTLALLLHSLSGLLNTAGAQSTAQERPPYFDPNRWEEAVLAFEAEDKAAPPPEGEVVFIGSSSIRMWHNTIAEDMAPLKVIPRGFGGSTMQDAIYFAGRIVIKYKPKIVVLYEGDNDIGYFGVTPERVLELFKVFVAAVHEALPETRIYFLAIKPSIARWASWPQMQKANKLISAACAASDLLTYIDVASPLLNEKGEPRKHILMDDMLHLNKDGYAIWTAVVRKVLMDNEGQHVAK